MTCKQSQQVNIVLQKCQADIFLVGSVDLLAAALLTTTAGADCCSFPLLFHVYLNCPPPETMHSRLLRIGPAVPLRNRRWVCLISTRWWLTKRVWALIAIVHGIILSCSLAFQLITMIKKNGKQNKQQTIRLVMSARILCSLPLTLKANLIKLI